MEYTNSSQESLARGVDDTDDCQSAESTEREREQEDEVRFFPPLWQQRRNLARSILDENHATSVIDFGCGEAALMSFLVWESIGDYPITRLAGVDMDDTRLAIAEDECLPREFELGSNLRVNELTVEIFHGSVAQADQRMLGYDALACLEVVEHLDPDVLEKFWSVVLGTLRPKLVIVSTPNAEFNVYFPQLNYGTPEAIFRNDDHRFEWTRQEFQDWCNPAAEQYGYSVAFTGTGMLAKGDPEIGFCTQFAILKLKDTSANTPPPPPTEPVKEHYSLFSKIEYPVYNTNHTDEEILAHIHDKIARIRPRPPRVYPDDEDDDYRNGYNNDWRNEQDERKSQDGAEESKLSKVESMTESESDEATRSEIELGVLALEDLWAALDVRQRCKRRSEMVRILKTSPLVRIDVEQDKVHFDEEDEYWKEWERQYELDNPVYDRYANTMINDLSDGREDDDGFDWSNDDYSGQTMEETPVEVDLDPQDGYQAGSGWGDGIKHDQKDANSPWTTPTYQGNASHPDGGRWE